MGACYLSMEMTASNEKLLHKKFDKIKRECEIQEGLDPYNGTWSTIDRIQVISDPLPGKRWTKKKIQYVFEYIDNRVDKHEALAIKKGKSNKWVVGEWPHHKYFKTGLTF